MTRIGSFSMGILLSVLVSLPTVAAPIEAGFGPETLVALRSPERTVELTLTLPDGRSGVASLERFDVFAKSGRLVEGTDAGDVEIPHPDLVLRHGSLLGDPRSLVYVSVGPVEAHGFLRVDGAIYEIVPDPATGRHRIAALSDLAPPNPKHKCAVDEAAQWLGKARDTALAQAPRKSPAATLEVEMAVDADKNLFDYFGSSAAASAYITSLLGAVSTIYQRDVDTVITVSYLRVWTTADPYTGTTSLDVLNQFVAYWTANMGGTPRDIAHLLTKQGFGGIAYLDVLCNNSYGYAVSGIDAIYTYPNSSYTWDCDVVSHETGHNFGSPHTHCYVPPIDKCYNQESGCYSGPVVPQVGTIMSYCHLVASKVLTFSPQEQVVIRGGADNAACVGPYTGGGCTDDTYEPNDTFATAATIPTGSLNYALQWCDNEDYFGIALVPGDGLSVGISFNPADADFALVLQDPAGAVLDTSNGTGNTETVSLASAATAGVYRVRVSASPAGRKGPYAMATYYTGTTPASRTLAGPGPGPGNPNLVRAFDSSAVMRTEILAFAAGNSGTNVGAGDIDNDGIDEILAGPGPGVTYGPQVRAFESSSAPVNGVNFFAYGTLRFGVKVTAGDLDGDAIDEIVTTPGAGGVFGPHVRGWNYDGAVLTAMNNVTFFSFGTLKWGANGATAQLVGGGAAEILTTPGPGANFASNVRGWNVLPSKVTPLLNFVASSTLYGATVAGPDVDTDSFGEILVGAGPGPAIAASVFTFNYDGTSITALPGGSFTAFAGSRYGVWAAGSDWTGDGVPEAQLGLGPDPAYAGKLRAYQYSGASYTLIGASDFTAYSTMYGATAAGGSMP